MSSKNKVDEFDDSSLLSNSIFRESPGYIFWKDLNSVYKGCNQNGAILYGVSSPEEIIGKTDADFSQEFAAEFVKQDQTVIKTGQLHVSENDIITGINGKHLILRTEKKPLRNANGKIIGVLGHAIDVTAEKEAERLKLENEAHKAVKEEQKNFQLFVEQLLHVINSYKLSSLNYKTGQIQPDIPTNDIELTKREREILYYLSLNKSPKEIAQILSILDGKDKGINHKTVQSFIDSHLYPKFKVYTIGQLIEAANMKKLIPFLLE